MSDYKFESKIFNGIEMISHKDLFESADGKIPKVYQKWSIFRDNKITDEITYHCTRKTYLPTN